MIPGPITDETVDAVAVIGMAGRFPGAGDVDEFWQNLRHGVESITFFTDEELLAAGNPADFVGHPAYVKAKGVLDGVELFDALFFGHTPKEAQLMDPQQRIFLECGWHALENSGYNADVYRGAIGVFAGAAFNGYLYHNVLGHPDAAQAIAYDKDFLSTRLSYKLNLNGPSLVVQTACSTSLVAVCQACQSLLSFQCDMALAGGVTVSLPAKTGYFYQEGSILSPDGHCRPFDAMARGTVMGSGVGLVVLKRLADAIADRDRIRAVIKGFAINNDGAKKMGYMAPSIEGQAHVIRLAQALAGVDADSIGYVEAHGTATELGDPIEVAALTQAFRAGTRRTGFCALGSVKGNIGHLDTAAGIASLIKTVLALEHKQLPPSLHFEQPNPKIDFANSPFFVNTRLTDWKPGVTPRRAGVSSFGIGGTNAHVVLEEAPERDASVDSPRWQLLTISARSETSLARATVDLREYLKAHQDRRLADVAYTLHVGRKKFPHARAVVCRGADDAAAALETGDPRYVLTGVHEEAEQPIVFMFPGQGAQYLNMGLDLYRTEPTFARHVDECCDLLRIDLGFDLRDVLYPTDGETETAAERFRETLLTQSALFVVEYALARLWMAWGIQPSAFVGHSIGEYVAACLSGALSLEHALKLVVVRGRLMQDAPAGGMVAVPLGEDRVRELLNGRVSLSAVNGSAQCVVAGEYAEIEALEARLRDEAVTYQRLQTSGAFHSALMTGVAEPLAAAARAMRIGRPRIPYVSNVTGDWIHDTELQDPSYWGRHVRQTVRFGACVDTLLTWGARVFVEVGPGQTLSGLVRQQIASRSGSVARAAVIASLPAAQEAVSDGESVARALGRLWLAGATPDWPAYHAGERRLRVEVPAYPFDRKRYWAEPGLAAAPPRQSSAADAGVDPRAEMDDWFAIPSWSRSQAPLVHEETGVERSPWLVFVDASSPGEPIADRLERRGHVVIRVRRGTSFERLANGAYAIDPASRTDYDSLVADLRSMDRMPRRMLHLWALGSPAERRADEAFEEDCRARGFDALLYLAQAWGDGASQSNLRAIVVADAIHDVTGRDPVCPEKATVLGPVRVLPQEYPNVSCRLIDVLASEMRPPSRVFDQLVAELESDAADPTVAYRGIDRWVQTFEPVRLQSQSGRPEALRDGGVYLITGGYGAIGLELARYLVKVTRPKLVLVGRGGVPARELWHKHIALHGREDAVSRRIRAVRALEESGAEVMTARADVASESQMREVIAAARQRFGRIDGVIHAAGIAGGGVMQLRDRDAVAAVMQAKVLGTRVLERVLAGEPLDFMVLCSSLNAVTGGVGQVDYCAANAYLDAFARRQTVSGETFTVSIDWDTWREVGMAADAQLPHDLTHAHERALARGLTSDEGVEVFRRCLAARQPQLLVSTRGWHRTGADERPNERDGAASSPSPARAQARNDAPLNPRPNLATPYVAPQDDACRRICDVWRDALGIEPVGADDSFFDLGGHSLLAIQVVARLNADFGTRIPVARLYEGLTPGFFAGLVRDARPSELADRAGAEERSERLTRQKQHQERRRVGRTGHRRLVQ